MSLTKQQLAQIQPLREAMVRRVLAGSLVVLPIHTILVARIGMPATLKNLTGTILWPAICMLATVFCLRWGKPAWRIPLATAMLFSGIVFSAVVPQAALAATPGYSYYGGLITLTILLSGLLIGEFYVGAWTLICCVSFQFAISQASGWIVNSGWCAVYLGAAWLVILFARHLERLHEASRVAEEQQRSAIVAERTRFARDIHDALAQGLTAIMTQLQAAEHQLGDAGQARLHVQKARQLASDSLEEARRSVSALRSTALEKSTLLGAIEQIGQKLTADSELRLETKLDGQAYPLPEQIETNLLRIAQEAMTNAVRHASATAIEVLLSYRTASVVLEVRDSGHGMSGRESSGFGIDGMRQRARDIGGEMTIVSNPDRGTRITVTVPNASAQHLG